MKLIETLKNVWKITELKDRIILTLGMLLVYRFGAQVVLPGVDASQLGGLQDNAEGGILGLLNAFTGGAFANASVFALGIMPYISASIISNLVVATTPSLQQLRKEGEAGRRKIAQYTRYGTLVLALVQGFAMSNGLVSQGLAYLPGISFHFVAITTLVTGAMFMMWLGEQVTERGIGNGISILYASRSGFSLRFRSQLSAKKS